MGLTLTGLLRGMSSKELTERMALWSLKNEEMEKARERGRRGA
jgi:hypothetical protein